MRKAVVVLCVGIFMGLVGTSFAAEKLAYVDLSKIFGEFYKTKDYDKVLSDKETAYSTEREKKVGELKALQDKMSLLSDKEKETKRADVESKVKAFQEFDRQKQTDLRKEQDEKMKEILKDIELAVKKYAEQEGYTIVFNDRVLVYQTKNLDITDKVIEILNAKKKQ